MDKQNLPELLTPRQACDILKVHANTPRLWDHKGILKAVRFGQRGDRRYRREYVVAFINTPGEELQR
ncbi:MAG: hypothetical protein KatS3mg087_0289 [Patescibacteria group bacterium]|nr:MAG: hypothetical protein KatS3mg087_0289 [Patescibacteria group bacterium]